MIVFVGFLSSGELISQLYILQQVKRDLLWIIYIYRGYINIYCYDYWYFEIYITLYKYHATCSFGASQVIFKQVYLVDNHLSSNLKKGKRLENWFGFCTPLDTLLNKFVLKKMQLKRNIIFILFSNGNFMFHV